jgi:hypothetical protein
LGLNSGEPDVGVGTDIGGIVGPDDVGSQLEVEHFGWKMAWFVG